MDSYGILSIFRWQTGYSSIAHVGSGLSAGHLFPGSRQAISQMSQGVFAAVFVCESFYTALRAET